MNYPEIGQTVEIHSYKHNSKIHRIWHETTILDISDEVVIGANNTQYWFNVLCMLRKDGVYFYCNLSSPFVYDQQTIKYIDYDLDVKVFPDLSYRILDEDEYHKHSNEMGYSLEVQEIIKQQLDILINMIETRRGPFAPGFAEYWYYVYKNRLLKR